MSSVVDDVTRRGGEYLWTSPDEYYCSKSTNTTMYKYSITTKNPAFKILLKYKYKSTMYYMYQNQKYSQLPVV